MGGKNSRRIGRMKIKNLGWGMEILFSAYLLLAKLLGVIFKDNIGWVPFFAIIFGLVMFTFAFDRHMNAKRVKRDAEEAMFYMHGYLASLMLCVAGSVALY